MTSHAPAPLFDFTDLTDPFGHMARLHAGGPVFRITPPPHFGGVVTWLVTRLDEAVRVFKDPRFTVDVDLVYPSGLPGDLQQLFGRNMVSVDGADHARLRGLVARVFTPRYIQTLRPAVQRLADELLDRVAAQGRMDLVRDFSLPLPINVISDMLGVPPHYRAVIRAWSEALSGIAPGSGAERRAKLREMLSYAQGLIAEKRQQPQDDLLSYLIALEADGDRLSEDELVSTAALLIVAGHETTANLIGLGALTLLDHPAQLARLRADPSLVPQAVEELLRFNSPVLLPARRFATEDLELAGQQIRRGEIVMVSLAAASHDPAAFPDPEEFAVAREIRAQIAFGQGVHICLGAPLARLEGEIAFATLLRRAPGLRLGVPREQVAWGGSMFVRRLKTLLVVFDVAESR